MYNYYLTYGFFSCIYLIYGLQIHNCKKYHHFTICIGGSFVSLLCIFSVCGLVHWCPSFRHLVLNVYFTLALFLVKLSDYVSGFIIWSCNLV